MIRAACAAFAVFSLSGPAVAQQGEIDIPYGGEEKPRPADLSPFLELPPELPAVRSFEQMTEFTTDGSSSNRFALDPASVRLLPHYVLATVAVLSQSGASTIGYYGFACNHLQYRLMAYPDSKGGWQISSSRARWRPVRDGDTRNRHFRAVYAAACRIGGRSAESTDELLRHLREGRKLISP